MKSLNVRNFAAFADADLEFSSGLNVLVGENGTGKTLLMKLAYAVMRVAAERERGQPGQLAKSWLERRIAEKLQAVIRPESLGRLVRRRQGRGRCDVAVESNGALAFSFAAQSRTTVNVHQVPRPSQTNQPVFLPTRELMTIYPGFLALYDNYYTEFDETWRDACQLLGAPAVKGSREQEIGRLLCPLEEAMGGRVVLDSRADRFYLQGATGRVEMPLVAEGVRKLAMLARLTATGKLMDKDCLFWDEPETNLNPKLMRSTARAILDVCASGAQVFVATHSLFMLREFDILCSTSHAEAERRFFAFDKANAAVTVQQADDLADVAPLLLLDEDLEQSDRYLAMEEGLDHIG